MVTEFVEWRKLISKPGEQKVGRDKVGLSANQEASQCLQ